MSRAIFIALLKWIFYVWADFVVIVLVYREAVRNVVRTTSSNAITTCASRSSGCVMARKTARWAKMNGTARRQVQNKSPVFT